MLGIRNEEHSTRRGEGGALLGHYHCNPSSARELQKSNERKYTYLLLTELKSNEMKRTRVYLLSALYCSE
jgi:hypothetical protein